MTGHKNKCEELLDVLYEYVDGDGAAKRGRSCSATSMNARSACRRWGWSNKYDSCCVPVVPSQLLASSALGLPRSFACGTRSGDTKAKAELASQKPGCPPYRSEGGHPGSGGSHPRGALGIWALPVVCLLLAAILALTATLAHCSSFKWV